MQDLAASLQFITILLFSTIFAVFAMKYFALTHRSKTHASVDKLARDLTIKTERIQLTCGTTLEAIETDMSEIKQRLIIIENLLYATERKHHELEVM
ncbi:MAG: hypothetical protein JKY24_06955 [Pseudomonadales bacterium]|nr:hypothetical protein [Pseudomonadales bacterium]